VGKEIRGPLLESKVSLIREEGHVCTKETWITEWLFVRPPVVTPKLQAQLAVRISILTGNDQYYSFLTLAATFRSYGQTVSKAGQGSSWQVPRVHKFYKYLEATSKFYASQWW